MANLGNNFYLRFESFDQLRIQRERERERVKIPHVIGIPIGNLTSQLFANIYLNEFDYFVKHGLRVKHYARYTDDFVIVTANEENLLKLIPKIQEFLAIKLNLEIHPNKISIRKFRQGIDFLGYVVLPKYRLLRNKTKRRIIKKSRKRIIEFKSGLIKEETLTQSLNSYLGVLLHANTYEFQEKLINLYWFWLKE